MGCLVARLGRVPTLPANDFNGAGDPRDIVVRHLEGGAPRDAPAAGHLPPEPSQAGLEKGANLVMCQVVGAFLAELGEIPGAPWHPVPTQGANCRVRR